MASGKFDAMENMALMFCGSATMRSCLPVAPDTADLEGGVRGSPRYWSTDSMTTKMPRMFYGAVDDGRAPPGFDSHGCQTRSGRYERLAFQNFECKTTNGKTTNATCQVADEPIFHSNARVVLKYKGPNDAQNYLCVDDDGPWMDGTVLSMKLDFMQMLARGQPSTKCATHRFCISPGARGVADDPEPRDIYQAAQSEANPLQCQSHTPPDTHNPRESKLDVDWWECDYNVKVVCGIWPVRLRRPVVLTKPMLAKITPHGVKMCFDRAPDAEDAAAGFWGSVDTVIPESPHPVTVTKLTLKPAPAPQPTGNEADAQMSAAQMSAAQMAQMSAAQTSGPEGQEKEDKEKTRRRKTRGRRTSILAQRRNRSAGRFRSIESDRDGRKSRKLRPFTSTTGPSSPVPSLPR